VVVLFFFFCFRHSNNGVVADRDRNSSLYGTDIDNRLDGAGFEFWRGLQTSFFKTSGHSRPEGER